MSQPEIVRLVPVGKDAIDDLTLKELSVASQAVQGDVVRTAKGDSAKKYAALAQIACAWSRRQDPRATAAPFLELTGKELAVVLGWTDDEESAEDLEDVDPMDLTDGSASA